MLKGLGNLAGLMKQAQEVSGRLQSLGQELKSQKVTGQAGGGMIEVDANGALEILACRIDPALLAQQDKELLEDLLAAAVNQALEKARQLHAEAMQKITSGVELPGLGEALGKLTDPSAES